MQKSSFFKIMTIAITAATMPTICMENPLEPSTKMPITIKVDLHLKKAERIFFKDEDKQDEHYCKVLGIDWEPNNNPYVVEYAFFHNLRPESQEKDFKRWTIDCWTNHIPYNLPQSTLRNPFIQQRTEYPDIPYQMNKFPSTLPATFVERLKELKEEETITLTDTKFEKPVTVILTLKNIEENATTASNTNEQKKLDVASPSTLFPSNYKGLCAHITDTKGKTYVCYLSVKDGVISVYTQKDNEEYKVIRICEIPTNETQYAYLLEITDNQWVIMDKDYKFYTWNKQSKYPLQYTKDSNHPVKALRNAVLINLSQETTHQESSEQNDQQLESSKKDTTTSSNTNEQREIDPMTQTHVISLAQSSLDSKDKPLAHKLDATLKQIAEDNKQQTKNNADNASSSTNNQKINNNSEKQQTTSKFTYIATAGGVVTVGIIAYILYLSQTNQLGTQLSRITDFFNNLIKQ